ncbi:MAG: hypothetical protein AB8B50_05080 [Pirellulaceae bacterium]
MPDNTHQSRNESSTHHDEFGVEKQFGSAVSTSSTVANVQSSVVKRPAYLRALGAEDPPASIQLRGESYERVDVYKHDSWAATALYQKQNGDSKVVCKFNRTESLGVLPMRWLGQWLAARERSAYARLADVPNIPDDMGPVQVKDAILEHAFAHVFVEGHPLGEDEQVGESFLAELQRVLKIMHERGLAYMDLHKRENILVSDKGAPIFVDFQICFLGGNRMWSLPPLRWIRTMLQRSDEFCLAKHVRRLAPAQLSILGLGSYQQPPWWIRLHRTVAVPFRQTRRKLLSRLRVRDQSGRCQSEVFAEHAFRTGAK